MYNNLYFLVITLVGVVLTFLVGILNWVVSVRNNKKTTYINAITSQRVKWIGELRGLIAEFVSLITLYDEKQFLEPGKDRGEYLDKVLELECKIELQLNYKGQADAEIIMLVENISKRVFEMYDLVSLIDVPEEKRIKRFLHMDSTVEKIKKAIQNNQISIEFESGELAMNEELLKTFSDIMMDFYKNGKHRPRQIKEEIKKYREELVRLTQVYLKEEWDRVKCEAESGNVK